MPEDREEMDDDFEDEEIDVDSDNEDMLRRQQNFRLAVQYVAAALAEIPAVEKVVLFGSVAKELWEEVPRFRRHRRQGIEILHECKDVDLAVWVSDLSCLRDLQKANSRTLVKLNAEKNVGVAHHQVDMFVMEPGTDRYLGRVCKFAACPKERRRECRVRGCGATRLLQVHEGFRFEWKAVPANETVVLFDRKVKG